MEGRPANGLMRTRGAVLPRPEGGVANLIRGATQARGRPRIDVGVSDPAPRGAGSIAEGIEVGAANRLPRPAAPIGIVEGGVSNVGARTGLGKAGWGEQEHSSCNCKNAEGDHEPLRSQV